MGEFHLIFFAIMGEIVFFQCYLLYRNRDYIISKVIAKKQNEYKIILNHLLELRANTKSS